MCGGGVKRLRIEINRLGKIRVTTTSNCSYKTVATVLGKPTHGCNAQMFIKMWPCSVFTFIQVVVGLTISFFITLVSKAMNAQLCITSPH